MTDDQRTHLGRILWGIADRRRAKGDAVWPSPRAVACFAGAGSDMVTRCVGPAGVILTSR